MPAKKNIRSIEPPEPPPPATPATDTLPTGPTGRYLITMAPGSQRRLIKSLKDNAGLSAASTADFQNAEVNMGTLGKADALILEHLGIAIVSGDDADKIQALEMSVLSDDNQVVAVEPEEYVHAINESGLLTHMGRDYVRGYRDGVADWAARLLSGQEEEEESRDEADAAAAFADTAKLTWGLQATRAHTSSATGSGIRVAVLDTGFAIGHPDFVGRAITSATFVGQPVNDLHGHGTHCTGTALGRHQLAGGVRRYGCARQGNILIGKVLTNEGSGMDGGILAGINWAVQRGARVISMSLGAQVGVGAPPSAAYENAGRAALNAGSLIIAAAGNNGGPVNRPANSPSIMAVAAVDQNLKRASFSCRGINPNGGEVNIAGPGVAVFSSWKMPPRYNTISGTSMATPHVAGIAAMWAQTTGLRGLALWNKLRATARNIGQTSKDVGAGLVQAPQ